MAGSASVVDRYLAACQAFETPARGDVEEALRESQTTGHFNFHRAHSVAPFGERLVGVETLPLFDALCEDSVITRLTLAYNSVGDTGCQGLASTLKHNVTLTAIDLSQCDIGAEGACAVAEAVELSNVTLKELDMSGNAIERTGGEAMARVIKRNTTLTRLNLADCAVDTRAIVAIATALATNETLQWVNVANPRLFGVQDEVAIHFGDALKQNDTLTFLGLAKYRLGDDGAARLAEALERNATLLELDISSNGIGQPGGLALGRLLARNATLQSIHADANRVRDEGAAGLAEGLRVNDALARLSLRNNSIGDAGLAALGRALAVNGALASIGLWGNDFGPTASDVWAGLLQSRRGEALEECDLTARMVDGKPQIARQSN